MTHTPTPWETDGVYIMRVGDERMITVANCYHSPRLDIPTAKANAAFIVKAVNSHDALVEALHGVSILGLQSTRYRDDADFRDAVDVGLSLTVFAETPANPIEEVVDEPSRS